MAGGNIPGGSEEAPVCVEAKDWDDIVAFGRLLTPRECEADVVQAAREKLLGAKSGTFYKALTLFPLGMAITNACDGYLAQCKQDARRGIQ